ncbi:MAG: hypothetical protein ABFS45_13260 [Pseudomonadota bacterium]
MTTQTTLTRELVPEDQRMATTERLFGLHFPLQLEPVIYGTPRGWPTITRVAFGSSTH